MLGSNTTASLAAFNISTPKICMGSSANLGQVERKDEERKGRILAENRWAVSHLYDAATKKAKVPPFYLLSVRVIRMKNLQKADIFSRNDCYVTLRLPTASFVDARTKTIANCRNPVWNETFFFRIQDMVKNVLELKVCEKNCLFGDDQLCTVLFDIAQLQPEKTENKTFELNEKKDGLLEVEFTLECMEKGRVLISASINCSKPLENGCSHALLPWPDIPENLVTNEVLVSRQLSCLEIEVDGKQTRKKCKEQCFTFNMKGSNEETRKIILGSQAKHLPPDSTEFHYVKYCNPEMEVALPNNRSSDKGSDSLTLSLNQLPMEEKVKIAKDKAYDVFATARDCQKDLDMHLGFDLCREEQDFVRKRKKYVAAALKNALWLEEDLQEDEIPIIAAMTTAGGVRSMTGMYGSLFGLKKLNLLDSISYITGLSGTTWTMIKLYEDAYWSQTNLEGLINEARKQILKSKLCCLSVDRLEYYEKEIWQRHLEGHKLCFTDFWGLLLESMFNDKPDPQKLSDQREAVNLGQNPLPIYLGLNVRRKYSTLDFKEWIEFTPYQVGLLKYGAFINTEDFGSEFFMGHLMKKIPESRISFLQGMWSNIYSQSVVDALYLANCPEDFWRWWTKNRIVDIDGDTPPPLPRRPYAQPARLFTPSGTLPEVLRDVVTLRPVVALFQDFTKGLQLNNKYLQNDRFCMWKDTVLDSCPNELRDGEEYLELVDTAFFINTSCPPLLRPERKVDVILHLNYSGGSQLLPLDLSVKYYAEQGIPFPKVGLTEKDREHLKECYLFDKSASPKAPILLYFPLVCDTFRKYKAPGVERSPSEMEDGQLDVTSTVFSPYATGLLEYSEKNFNKLLNLTCYNILNNEHLILQALRTAIERKKQLKKHNLFPSC